MSESEDCLQFLNESTKSGQNCDNNCNKFVDNYYVYSKPSINEISETLSHKTDKTDNCETIDRDLSSQLSEEFKLNPLKRRVDSDNYNNNNKRIKTNDSSDRFEFNSNESDCDLSQIESNGNQSVEDMTNGFNDNQLVPNNQNNDNTVCDINDEKELKPKKTPKQVKWRSSIVNPDFNEDCLLNVLLSETYYYYGTGIVTGEAGDMFGGNRFQGFSRHLLSDSTGITVELCKPFIINQILIELENKSHKKSPLFAYKVLIAIDECMDEWHLIKDFDQMVCFGPQTIQFYPRIVQYIRIIGSTGIYCEESNDSETRKESEARYFTLLNFDCIFDQKSI